MGQRVGLHDQFPSVLVKPTAAIARPDIYKIHGAVMLRGPVAILNLVFGSIDQDDAAGPQDRHHSPVTDANVPVDVVAMADFILHISRLADIENRGVVPGLHKLYTLAALYHLSPLEILRWYDVPLEECFHDGASFEVPQTHTMAAPASLRIPMKFDPAFDPRRTELLSRMVEKWTAASS